MDPRSRFLAALALASTISAINHGPGALAADPMSEEELYNLCKSGDKGACSAFLNAFPNSAYTPGVINDMTDDTGTNDTGGGTDGGSHDHWPTPIY